MASRARLHPSAWRGALWAWRTLRDVRGQLRARPFDEVRVSAPPRWGRSGHAGADAVLRRAQGRAATCLESALVRQAWYAARGDRRELVIAVGAPGEAFGAHAWLAGDPEDEHDPRPVLLRRPAP